MNPNQMMLNKAMVAQSALRDEAQRSRRQRTDSGRARGTKTDNRFLGLLRRR
jgi:hypothetical protein